MKTKFLYVSTAVIALFLTLYACNDDKDDVAVTSVTLDENTLTLEVGGTQTLVPTVLPTNATNKAVAWESDKTDVATVSNGLVTGIAAGEATITVTTEDGKQTAKCVVTVTPAGSSGIPVTGVAVNMSSITLGVGDQESLTSTVTPENATDKTLVWTSDDPEVATVDQNGLVTALAEGAATVTATAASGVSDQCTVNVSWLGRVSFRTPTTWTIGTQEWSDAVMATRCLKDDYDGGMYDSGEYKVDCRQSAEEYGNIFSWMAVDKYKNLLCPEGWRVPFTQDFIDLDIALGGDGTNRGLAGEFMPFYLETWGGEFAGYYWINFDGELVIDYVGQYAGYWTQTEVDQKTARALNFGTSYANVTPQAQGDKGNGFTLRCLKI